MPKQNYKNHSRIIPLWHYITLAVIIAVLIGSIVNLVKSSKENLYSASLLTAISLILASIFWYARAFALKAQDRAIRAEENLRHFALTGKLLDKRLRTSQIIALRFAPDHEFIELVQKAIDNKLRSGEIKKSVVSWKPDHHRV
ncbi:MAG: DUF6526 family protein [Chitinophagaceae bacterium]